MTLLANGQVGIGTTAPSIGAWLEVLPPQNGGSAGLDFNGTNGIIAIGATNPSGENAGGSGVVATGGHGLAQDGDGGFFDRRIGLVIWRWHRCRPRGFPTVLLTPARSPEM